MNSHKVNPLPAHQVLQVLHFGSYNTSSFTREQILGYEVMLPPVAEITSLALEATTTLAVKQRLPFSEASFALWCSPRILIACFVLLAIRSSLSIYPCLQRLLLCPHPTKLSSPLPYPDSPCPRGALFLQGLDSMRLHAQLLQRKFFFPDSSTGAQSAIQADKNSCEWCPPSPPLLNPPSKGMGS